MYKILQGSDTASGTVLQKNCSRICGLNPGLIYLQKVSKNSFLKLNFLKDIFQGFWLQHYNNSLKYMAKITLFHNSCLSEHKKFLKDFFSKFEDVGK